MKGRVLFKAILFLLICNSSLAQNESTIDSLLQELRLVKNDSLQVRTLSNLCKEYIKISDYDQAMEYATLAHQKSHKLNYKKGVANSFNSMGHIQMNKGLYEVAIEFFSKALKIFQEVDDKEGIAKSYNNIGIIYWIQGHFELALQNYLKSLKIREEIGDKPGIAGSYANIGIIYENQFNYDMALDKYFKSLKILEEIGDKSGIATLYNNIGIVYFDQLNYEKSLEYHLKSLKIKEETGDRQGMAYSYINIGNIYENQEKHENALESYLKALKINEEIGDKLGLASTYNGIGNIYRKQGKFKESLLYLDLSVNLFQKIGNLEGMKEVYFSLSELYDKKGDYGQAYSYHKRYSGIKDTLFNEQSSKQIAEMNTRYDSEKKDKELIKKEAEIVKQQASSAREVIIRNAFIVGFSLVLVLVFFIYRSYNQKKAANKLLDEKNKKITDSIDYARRIQQALLPTIAEFKKRLPVSFVMFHPKDIVSGDFYWMHSINADQTMIAAVDCTGHGVPGSLMSMLSYNLLDQVVKEKQIYEPAAVLNELSKLVVKSLKQTGKAGENSDGMDIALCKINHKTNNIEYAGAHNSIYRIRNREILEVKANSKSIGLSIGKEKSFTNHKIEFEKGDTFYLFSDGFADQKGGPDNSKFFYKPFRQLLIDINSLSMEEQERKLHKVLHEWRGEKEQVDDVLVIGFKI